MGNPFDKSNLLQKAIEDLQRQFELMANAAHQAREDSTNEESKAENKYDTRGLEASYLAQGQAERAQKLSESLFLLKKVQLKDFTATENLSVSALVCLRTDNSDKWVFLIPASGMTLKVDDHRIQTMSTTSPIGRILLDCKLGDTFDFNKKEYEICEVY